MSSCRIGVSFGVVKQKYGPLILVVVFALTRFPGVVPWNFSAAYALAFCAGVYFPRRMAWWLPLGVLLITDVLLNVFYYHTAVFSGYMAFNYLSYAAIIWLGRQFSHKSSWFKLVVGGLLSAIIFYLITNTAAWLQNPEYAKNLAGWIQALTVGTSGWPETWTFFRNTLFSGGLFTALFAGAMKLMGAAESTREKEPAEEPGDEQPDEAKA